MLLSILQTLSYKVEIYQNISIETFDTSSFNLSRSRLKIHSLDRVRNSLLYYAISMTIQWVHRAQNIKKNKMTTTLFLISWLLRTLMQTIDYLIIWIELNWKLLWIIYYLIFSHLSSQPLPSSIISITCIVYDLFLNEKMSVTNHSVLDDFISSCWNIGWAPFRTKIRDCFS